jgi:GNAT superfamily N-acetyltransferase
MASVTVIQPADRERATSTLMLAFASDPVVRWLLADPYVYAEYWPRIIDAFAGPAFAHGTSHRIEGFSAVALWLPPGVGSDDATMDSLINESATDSTRPDLDGFFGQMGESHPSFDHWYLPLAGVDPPAQGRGLGSTLLRHALQTCDRDGLPAYLEATAPRNRDLYARHGFETIGVIQHGASPSMWPMLRQPT